MSKEQKVYYDVMAEPLSISTVTYEILLKQDEPSDLWGLYNFYYYTAKWQLNNIARATTSYAAKGLKWSEARVRKNKKVLIELGLIENVVRKNTDTQAITGHFVKVNFVYGAAESHPNDKAQCGLSPGLAHRETNTLKTNNKIPLTGILNSLEDPQNNLNRLFIESSLSKADGNLSSITSKLFGKFWELYPNKKGSKGKALTSWNKLCAKKSGERPAWRILRRAVIEQKKSEQWQDPAFIPLASTWINQSRWLDNPDEMKAWKKDNTNTKTKKSGFVGKNKLGYKKTIGT